MHRSRLWFAIGLALALCSQVSGEECKDINALCIMDPNIKANLEVCKTNVTVQAQCQQTCGLCPKTTQLPATTVGTIPTAGDAVTTPTKLTTTPALATTPEPVKGTTTEVKTSEAARSTVGADISTATKPPPSTASEASTKPSKADQRKTLSPLMMEVKDAVKVTLHDVGEYNMKVVVNFLGNISKEDWAELSKALNAALVKLRVDAKKAAIIGVEHGVSINNNIIKLTRVSWKVAIQGPEKANQVVKRLQTDQTLGYEVQTNLKIELQTSLYGGDDFQSDKMQTKKAKENMKKVRKPFNENDWEVVGIAVSSVVAFILIIVATAVVHRIQAKRERMKKSIPEGKGDYDFERTIVPNNNNNTQL